MRVLLVRPPYTRLRGSGQAAYFPLGAGSIAAMLLAEGHEASVYNSENPAPDEPPPLIGKGDVFSHRSEAHRRYQRGYRSRTSCGA